MFIFSSGGYYSVLKITLLAAIKPNRKIWIDTVQLSIKVQIDNFVIIQTEICF